MLYTIFCGLEFLTKTTLNLLNNAYILHISLQNSDHTVYVIVKAPQHGNTAQGGVSRDSYSMR